MALSFYESFVDIVSGMDDKELSGLDRNYLAFYSQRLILYIAHLNKILSLLLGDAKNSIREQRSRKGFLSDYVDAAYRLLRTAEQYKRIISSDKGREIFKEELRMKAAEGVLLVVNGLKYNLPLLEPSIYALEDKTINEKMDFISKKLDSLL